MKNKKTILIAILTISLIGVFLSAPVANAAWDWAEDAWDSIKSGDVCNDINDGLQGILKCDSGDDITSFSGFSGGLAAPSGEGLSETLTRSKTAREFTVNAVNFALSFLGLIAMVFIIYGGFLYVTAGGEEEKSTKGKKTLTYAVVGILIIIVSYALVNTLLTVGGGESVGKSGMSGVAQEGSNLSQQNIYNLGAVEINAALNEFISGYKNLVNINGLFKKMDALPKPIERSENKNFLNEVKSAVTQIKDKSNALSKTHIAAQNFLDGWIAETAAKDLMASKYENGKLKGIFNDALEESGLKQASKNDFTDMVDKLNNKLELVKKVLGTIADTDVKSVMDTAIKTEQDVEKAFAGIDPTMPISGIFKNATDALTGAKVLADDPAQTELVTDTVKALYQLYIVVRDIKFVNVKIKASVKEGNAPLIIELSGLDSRDPTGQTIPDENYTWDPDGDGKDGPDNKKVTCNDDIKKPVITCTYKKTGTYLVRLKIESQNPAVIATGQALFSVTVKPPVARITLKAIAGPATNEYLRKYQKVGNEFQLLIDKNELQITKEEGKAGVSYDASESKGGDEQALKNFEWNFGDSTPSEKGKQKIDKHIYGREGKFPLMLEVTDSGNRKDRKIANIVIGPIAARIGVEKTIGEPEELIEFDGSLSKSDNGAITSYSWTVLNDKGTDITNLKNDVEIVGDSSASVLRVKFQKPGSYTVKLSVSDGDKTAETEVPISIKSRKPRANFVINSCPENCPDFASPSVVGFDASMSFDPDTTDVLTYNWEFFNEAGAKLEQITQFTILDNGELSGKNSKKVKIKFPSIGKYKAVLHVNDSHEDQNILQEDEKEKEFQVTSIVEARWGTAIKTVSKLEEGKASFSFEGTVKNAERVQIDFGDGESGEKGLELNTTNDQTFKFDHDYDKTGSFLVAVKAISDEGNGENTLQKRIYITGGKAPLAIMQIFLDGNEILLPDATLDNPNPTFEIIRNKALKFDASNSVTSEGKTGGLKYSWDFGDGKQSTGPKVEHSYEDLSPEDKPFKVTLTVSETADPNKISKAEFKVNVISKKPQMNTLSLEKKTAGEVAPVDVELTAEGAIDPDGKITNYQFWYYNPAEKDKKLSVIDTQYNYATLTVETAGEEKEEHEYVFCVSLTDNENTTSACSELFNENELPKLKVKNGPNKAPSASFSTDRTNAKVGEAITFTSSSKDEDGKIVKYVWDVDGDGFQNDNPTDISTVTYTYKKQSPKSGYKVKLKVIDDKNAAGFSKEIPIYISAKSNPPSANFTYQVQTTPLNRVKFFDTSKADAANGAKLVKWTWDFDTSSELGCAEANPKPAYCNGDKTDDIDSTDQNPVFDFASSDTKQVKLIVEDSDGNISDPKTALVNLIAGSTGGTAPGSSPVSNILNAELKTDPNYKNVGDKKIIELTGDGQNVTFFYGNSAGSILEYKIDKNIWCDSGAGEAGGGDGNRSNDKDFIYPDPEHPLNGKCKKAGTGQDSESCYTANYSRFAKTGHYLGAGHFTAMLTVTDIADKKDTDSVEIAFKGETDPAKVEKGGNCDGKIPLIKMMPQKINLLFKGSIFEGMGMPITILLSLLSGVIVILAIFGILNLFRKGKTRNE